MVLQWHKQKSKNKIHLLNLSLYHFSYVTNLGEEKYNPWHFAYDCYSYTLSYIQDLNYIVLMMLRTDM